MSSNTLKSGLIIVSTKSLHCKVQQISIDFGKIYKRENISRIPCDWILVETLEKVTGGACKYKSPSSDITKTYHQKGERIVDWSG